MMYISLYDYFCSLLLWLICIITSKPLKYLSYPIPLYSQKYGSRLLGLETFDKYTCIQVFIDLGSFILLSLLFIIICEILPFIRTPIAVQIFTTN